MPLELIKAAEKIADALTSIATDLLYLADKQRKQDGVALRTPQTAPTPAQPTGGGQ